MRVFVTGATGFIGKAVARELIAGGHQVLALSRSPEKASALEEMGAAIFEGSLADLARVREGALQANAIAHLAFNHDFSQFVESARLDQRVVEVLSEAATRTGAALLVTSGTLAVNAKPERPATEEDPALPMDRMPRSASEIAADKAVALGVRAFVVRPAHVHDASGCGGALAWLIDLARETGFSAYATDGEQRWPACPLSDTARLYRLAIEKGIAGQRYHAVAEEGVKMRDIARAVGRLQDVPVRALTLDEAHSHFGAVASFVTRDGPASSVLTRKSLDWTPTARGMIADIDATLEA